MGRRRLLRVVLVLAAGLLLAGIAGCGGARGTKPDEAQTAIVWPLPPDMPRYRYVTMYCGEHDLAPEKSVVDTLLGEAGPGFRLSWPRAVAVDSKGDLYVSDRFGLVKFDLERRKVVPLGKDPGVGRLSKPFAVAIGPDDALYVSDVAQKRVFVYNADGSFRMAIGHEGELDNPVGLALDPVRGRLYVSDSKKDTVRAYDNAGAFLFEISGRTEDPETHFGFPVQMAVNSEGYLYVVDTAGARLVIFTPEGEFDRVLGGIGILSGSFVRPKGVAIDSEDNVYVSDAATAKVQIFNANDEILMWLGTGGSGPGRFNLPAFLWIDGEDRVYVVSRGGGCVQVIQFLGSRYYELHPEEKIPETPGGGSESVR